MSVGLGEGVWLPGFVLDGMVLTHPRDDRARAAQRVSNTRIKVEAFGARWTQILKAVDPDGRPALVDRLAEHVERSSQALERMRIDLMTLSADGARVWVWGLIAGLKRVERGLRDLDEILARVVGVRATGRGEGASQPVEPPVEPRQTPRQTPSDPLRPHACLASACASRIPGIECDPPVGCVLKGVLAAIEAKPLTHTVWPRLNEASASGNGLIDALGEAGLIVWEIDWQGRLLVWPVQAEVVGE